MQSSSYITAKFCQVLPPSSTIFCQCRNITPPSTKACPQALYVRIISIGRSYLNIPLVAYRLYYTSTLPTYLGTLAVQVYQGNGYRILKAYRDC